VLRAGVHLPTNSDVFDPSVPIFFPFAAESWGGEFYRAWTLQRPDAY